LETKKQEIIICKTNGKREKHLMGEKEDIQDEGGGGPKKKRPLEQPQKKI